MTEYKIGDHVHAAFDAEILGRSLDGERMFLQYGNGDSVYLSREYLTLIRRALAVGDAVENGDPQPPLGTVLYDENTGQAWVRIGDGLWYVTGRPRGYTWGEIKEGYYTVLYVEGAK